MTRKQALAELIAKVDAGIWLPDLVAQIPDLRTDLTWKSYSGSLDAAKALHEVVLPGWWWKVGTCRVSDDACVSPEGPESVMPDGTEWSEHTDVDMRPPGNPARAWLLAILRALHSMEPDA